MQKEDFLSALDRHSETIAKIRDAAHLIHSSVNQHYDKTLPYSYHLDSVVTHAKEYAHEVCQSEDDILPIIFGAYFHDSIEDARLTYNNVMRIAQKFLDDRQAHMATEIVYALTNEKGRNRAERANDKYYEGIRTTPYAPLCKFADRLANVTYSAEHSSHRNPSMRHVYAQENPHFVLSITGTSAAEDPRMRVPETMVKALASKLTEN